MKDDLPTNKKLISDPYIIALLLIAPPVGLYLCKKYKIQWIKNWKVISALAVYILIVAWGFISFANGLNTPKVNSPLTHREYSEEIIPKTIKTTTDPTQVSDGEDGLKEFEYEIEYGEGKEISRIIISEKIIKQPEAKIVMEEQSDEQAD